LALILLPYDPAVWYIIVDWWNGHWVFGGIEKDSGKCFLIEVPDRYAATLQPFIEQYILPGSHIVSDGWQLMPTLM